MSRAGFDVVVIGGANTDFLVKGGALPKPDTTVQGERFLEGPGGKGANQAVASARLGARTAFVGKLGSDARGDALLETLNSESVDTRFVTRDKRAPTGVALVAVDEKGHPQIITAPGANSRLTVREVLEASEHVANARVVLLQLEIPPEAIEVAMRLARAAGARVVMDPSPPRELPEDVLKELHVICPDAAEAQVLTGIAVTDRASARRAADNLLRRGVAAALIGAPGGNLLVTPEGDCWFPNLRVSVVDTTGASDALVAALAACIARGEMLPDAARFATAAAALKTTRLGAQAGMPSRREVERMLCGVEPAQQPGA